MCQALTELCDCGLSKLVTRNHEAIQAGELEIASYWWRPSPTELPKAAHCVIDLKQRVVQQFLGDALAATMGPFVPGVGDQPWQDFMDHITQRQRFRLAAKPTVN